MRGLLLATLLLCAACTETTYRPMRDSPDYVSNVLEDVTAMLEGMSRAHTVDRMVFQQPNGVPAQQPVTN